MDDVSAVDAGSAHVVHNDSVFFSSWFDLLHYVFWEPHVAVCFVKEVFKVGKPTWEELWHVCLGVLKW